MNTDTFSLYDDLNHKQLRSDVACSLEDLPSEIADQLRPFYKQRGPLRLVPCVVKAFFAAKCGTTLFSKSIVSDWAEHDPDLDVKSVDTKTFRRLKAILMNGSRHEPILEELLPSSGFRDGKKRLAALVSLRMSVLRNPLAAKVGGEQALRDQEKLFLTLHGFAPKQECSEVA